MGLLINDVIRRKIESYINDHRLTLDQFGEKCGVNGATVSRWLNGDVKNLNTRNTAALKEVIDLTTEPISDLEHDGKPLSAVERMLIEQTRKLDETGKFEALKAVQEIWERSDSLTKTSRFDRPKKETAKDRYDDELTG